MRNVVQLIFTFPVACYSRIHMPYTIKNKEFCMKINHKFALEGREHMQDTHYCLGISFIS